MSKIEDKDIDDLDEGDLKADEGAVIDRLSEEFDGDPDTVMDKLDDLGLDIDDLNL